MKIIFKNTQAVFKTIIENVKTILSELQTGFVSYSGTTIVQDMSSVFKMFSSRYGGKKLSIDAPLKFTTSAGTYEAYLYIVDAVSPDGETSISSSSNIYGYHDNVTSDISKYSAYKLTKDTNVTLPIIEDGHYYLIGIMYLRDNNGVAAPGNVSNIDSSSQYIFYFDD